MSVTHKAGTPRTQREQPPLHLSGESALAQLETALVMAPDAMTLGAMVAYARAAGRWDHEVWGAFRAGADAPASRLVDDGSTIHIDDTGRRVRSYEDGTTGPVARNYLEMLLRELGYRLYSAVCQIREPSGCRVMHDGDRMVLAMIDSAVIGELGAIPPDRWQEIRVPRRDSGGEITRDADGYALSEPRLVLARELRARDLASRTLRENAPQFPGKTAADLAARWLAMVDGATQEAAQ